MLIAMASKPTLIKKYGNRRLYDTGESRYITLEELATKVRGGEDVRVVDAKSGEDLTGQTLTQIIIEGRGAARLLPVPLLIQLVRLGDDALAEFFGRWVSGALEVYLQARRGANAVSTLNPFATVPFAASDALARLWMASPFGGQQRPGTPPPMHYDAPVAAEEPAATADDVAALRREIAALRRDMIDDRDDDEDDDELDDEAPPPKPRRKRSPAGRKKQR